MAKKRIFILSLFLSGIVLTAHQADAGLFSWLRGTRGDKSQCDCAQCRHDRCQAALEDDDDDGEGCCCFNPADPPTTRFLMNLPIEVDPQLPSTDQGEETSGQVDQLQTDLQALDEDLTRLTLMVEKLSQSVYGAPGE